jgi:hypothetical protein
VEGVVRVFLRGGRVVLVCVVVLKKGGRNYGYGKEKVMMREIWLWEGKEKEEERGRQSISDKAFLNTLEGLVFCSLAIPIRIEVMILDRAGMELGARTGFPYFENKEQNAQAIYLYRL